MNDEVLRALLESIGEHYSFDPLAGKEPCVIDCGRVWIQTRNALSIYADSDVTRAARKVSNGDI
jgi:hypothetical protein